MANKHLKNDTEIPQGAHAAPKGEGAPPEREPAAGRRLRVIHPEEDGSDAPGKKSPKKKTSSKGKNGSPAKRSAPAGDGAKHARRAAGEEAKTAKHAGAGKEAKAAKPAKGAKKPKQPSGGEKKSGGAKAAKPATLAPAEPRKIPKANKTAREKPAEGGMAFRREKAEELPEDSQMSQRDAVSALIALIAALVLLAATVVIWYYRDSFSPDEMILSADTAAVARDEYVFDAGSGDAFAAAGRGLAVANRAGLELLDGNGTAVTSKLMQMENPAAAGCEDFAVFYDLGGTRLAVAYFDGSVLELSVPGDILSVTVSPGGYIAVTTEDTGYRGLVTVYDPDLNEIYLWYSSSAWVISGAVSPDGRQLAVLSYTASGSEVRFFDLSQSGDEPKAAFAVDNTILLDVHWFSSGRLCALSSEQMFFFDSDGQWQNTYAFAGQYLIGYTFDGANCAALALSPYRTGTTATLVSLDPAGTELGTAALDSGLVCLTASDLEIMALCSDGAILYNSSLSEKGRLDGLPGFKYALLRSRGEALLIAPNYAEVYAF